MEQMFYTVERSQQIVISLLKQYGIRKIIISPGATNITFVASVQHDSWFELYSSVDERSAAYMACGMAAESGEPVVLTCTGATASRNYVPGLTEAYYRKLPVLAITATQDERRIGHLVPQVIDRSNIQNDIAVCSEHIRASFDKDDEWDATIRANRAIQALWHHGGGPVHMNLQTTYNRDFSVKELPKALKIPRYTFGDKLPAIEGKVGIFLGAHTIFTPQLTELVDKFCTKYGAIVFCDHTSNYQGAFRAMFALIGTQSIHRCNVGTMDLLIHMGEVSGNYAGSISACKKVWRLSSDGELRDKVHKLTAVFEMSDEDFFEQYTHDYDGVIAVTNSWMEQYKTEYNLLYNMIPELPFSNIWMAQHTIGKLPKNSFLHLGILNSLRSWNLFDCHSSIYGSSNTGGFGIDGILSTVLGASLVHPKQLHFCVIGDLAFFYDLNAVANRHVASNIRILMVNNGKGTEFRIYNHPGNAFGEEADEFIAAAGHYGNKSHKLVRHYAEDLGFEYLTASNKEEYLRVMERFINPELTDRPMLFEVFTKSEDESQALYEINHLTPNKEDVIKIKMKEISEKVLSEKVVNSLKKIIK